MKRRLAFYVAWDLIFYLSLFVLVNYRNWAQRAYFKWIDHNYQWIWLGAIVLMMIVGVLICWLVFVTGKYEYTRKTAAIEFVMVGGFAFYLATMIIFYFMMPMLIDGTFPRLIPGWVMHDENSIVMTLGSILFGYELCIFIIRMVKLSKKAKMAETETESKTEME